jgi:hypothetical protein
VLCIGEQKNFPRVHGEIWQREPAQRIDGRLPIILDQRPVSDECIKQRAGRDQVAHRVLDGYAWQKDLLVHDAGPMPEGEGCGNQVLPAKAEEPDRRDLIGTFGHCRIRRSVTRRCLMQVDAIADRH